MGSRSSVGLTGAPYTALPEPPRLDVPFNRLERWTQQHLTSLHERTKWQLEDDHLKVDTLVVIKETNLPPSKWILGSIQEVHAGPDDKVRVVTVKTAQGVFKRPITKLAILPLC